MLSEKMLALGESRSVIRELFEYGQRRKQEIGAENVFDFSLGNPSVPSPEEVRAAISELISSTDSVVLHGYTSATGDLSARQAAARQESLRAGYELGAESIYMTCGAAASLAIAIKAMTCPGDEIVLLAPFFPEYQVFVESAGARAVVVPPADASMQPDLKALEQAVGAHTKAVIVNSPNNPSGAILSAETLRAMGEILRGAEKAYGTDIYLIADEPYRELVYGGQSVPFVPNFYSDTVVCYSYSKSLSLPGERIGYILVPPCVRESEKLFAAVCGAGRALGYVCAPSLFQRVAALCGSARPDLAAYDRNRTLIYGALTKLGFTCVRPDGAFYLFIQAPAGMTADAFCAMAREQELLLVPSGSFGMEGYIRLAYCVSEEMLRRSLPAFEKLSRNCFQSN